MQLYNVFLSKYYYPCRRIFFLNFRYFSFSLPYIIFLKRVKCGISAKGSTMKCNCSILIFALFSIIQGVKMCGKEFNKAFELYDQVKKKKCFLSVILFFRKIQKKGKKASISRLYLKKHELLKLLSQFILVIGNELCYIPNQTNLIQIPCYNLSPVNCE